MPILDVEKLLAPLSPDAPAGADLGYDPAYLELDRVVQGTPERQVGDAIIPAEEPNWRAVADAARELLGRSKDLRLILHATLAALKLDGLAGLRDGLALLRNTLEHHWDTLYPRLDPEDPDPLERVNILAALVAPQAFLRHVREAELCNSARLGRFSLRDILIARGELAAAPGAAQAHADAAQVDSAFQDAPSDALLATAQAVGEVVAHVRGMDEFLTKTIGADKTQGLGPLLSLLEQIRKELDTQLAKRGYGTAAPEAAAAAAGGPPQAAAAGQALSGEVRSPQDVLAAIDKICRYYEAHEPSSPVPLLLRRAHRLVSRNFLDIVRDLSPETIRQIEVICGLDTGGGQQ